MTNKLIKTTTFSLVKPAPYIEYIPAYRYPIGNNEQYVINSTGLNYVVSYLKARGFNATLFNVNILFYNKIGIVVYVQVFSIPRIDSFGIYHWESPALIPLRLGDYTVLSNTNYVNVPASNTTVIPPPYYKIVNSSNWDGIGISKDSFYKKGYVEFSVSIQTVGTFVGVLNNSKSTGFTYQQLDYCIYTHLGIYVCYVNNQRVTSSSSYTNTDIFKIELRDTSVIFYKNNVEIYSTSIITNSYSYVLASYLYTSSDIILNSAITQSELNEFNTTIRIPFIVESIPTTFIGSLVSIPIIVDTTQIVTIQEFNLVVSIPFKVNIFPNDFIGSIIELPISLTMYLDGVVPNVPLATIVEIPLKVYIREHYVYPPKMFVIT